MIKRWLRRMGLGAAIAAALAGTWAGYMRLTGNFHSVEEGMIYRSGQLSGEQFDSRIREHGIRTNINLRGNNKGASWYDNEMKISMASGVRHVDFPLSARHEWTDSQIDELVILLRDSPRPLLIHCEAGADRSGMASAIYKLFVAGLPPDEASGQLSLSYGHFPWLFNSTAAMDRTFERIRTRKSALQSKN